MSQPSCVVEEKPAKNLASLVKNAALENLTSALIHQWNIREAFHEVNEFGIKPIDRALFYGPPGNGKTMAAQMIAREIDVPLYRVRCESMITSALGSTESNMANTLAWISMQGPAVVLFDECEAIFPKRSGGADQCSQTIVRAMQVFWQQLDRWESPQLFLLATNMIEQLDDALISRLELKLEFVAPTSDQALKVISYWAETLHEYGAESWSAALEKQIKKGKKPESFRQLWQWISDSVRANIVAANPGDA